jgi:hypothetical protein
VEKHELAIQVVVAVADAAASLKSPGAGAMATVISPFAIDALGRISDTLGRRRLNHGAETLEDGAEAYGAKTPEEFAAFIEAAISDAEHQELLARALTIAQDTAMRDKRRALGRALASAAGDTGTKVDEELLFIRVLDELDEPHVRLLRLMSTPPPSLEVINRAQRRDVGLPPIRQWHPPEIAQVDPGLGDVMWGLLPVLNRLRLIDGNEAEYTINSYGEWVLTRLAAAADVTP